MKTEVLGRQPTRTVGAGLAVAHPGGERRGVAAALAGLSGLASVIHLAVIPEHLQESGLFAAAFAGMALMQALWAGLVMVSPSRRTYALGALLNVAIVLIWVLSRTTGLPVGPHPGVPESISLADAAATTCEVLAVIGAMTLWARMDSRPSRTTPKPRTPVWRAAPLPRVGTGVGALPVLLRAGFALLGAGSAISIAGHLVVGTHGSGGPCCGPGFIGHFLILTGMVLSLAGVFVAAFRPRKGSVPPRERRSE